MLRPNQSFVCELDATESSLNTFQSPNYSQCIVMNVTSLRDGRLLQFGTTDESFSTNVSNVDVYTNSYLITPSVKATPSVEATPSNRTVTCKEMVAQIAQTCGFKDVSSIMNIIEDYCNTDCQYVCVPLVLFFSHCF